MSFQSVETVQIVRVFTHRLAADLNPGMGQKLTGYPPGTYSQIAGDATPREHPAQGQATRQAGFERNMQASGYLHQSVQALCTDKSIHGNLPLSGERRNAQPFSCKQAQQNAKNKKSQPGFEQEEPLSG